MKKTLLLLTALLAGVGAAAQTVTYALPRTAIEFEVEASQEVFHAGPYARYAAKYLGVEARTQDATGYTITAIRLRPTVEADQSVRYSVSLGGSAENALLQLTSQGLVAGQEGSFSHEAGWKFPLAAVSDFAMRGVPANLTTGTGVLHAGAGIVEQDMLVEKTPEQKASEVAELIFEIRRNKYKILVGDTDATYSGEAMKATIDELNRLEQDYISLFMGYSQYNTQKASFEVVFEIGNKNQVYVAFRISDQEGLVPSDNMMGKPIYLELKPEKVDMPSDAKESNGLRYRIPAVCAARLHDGVNTLLQTRIPVYQLGIITTYPIKK